MSSPDEIQLEELAAAILDGTEVDWGTEEFLGASPRLPLIEHLKVVAAVAAVHRQPAPALDQWAHLRVLERIGRGSFGEVFRAWDPRLDREVALKLLPVAGERDTSSFIEEGRLLARVRHPNVATIYGADQVDNRIGLWMELVSGRTLEQVLQDGPFSVPDAARIGIEICRAVAAVHRAGLLHRDIKAHNVMLAEDGRVVLMDFGSGRELKDGSASDRSGTPLYQAPEVFRGEPATVRSDVYSLGILLFHLLSRSYPVQAVTTAELRQVHETTDRVALQTLAPKVPAALARAIERATDPLTARRYADADAFAHDLAALERRPVIQRFRYGFIAAAAVLLAVAALEGRARLVGDEQGLRDRMVSLIFGPPSSVQRPVIVVLPFTNLSTESAGSRVIDSLTAGLIQQLAKIDGLSVLGQKTSFALRTKPLDLASISKLAGATLIVKGDAELSGGTLVIRAALQRVSGGELIWADTLTREVRSPTDLTDVLVDIAETIAHELLLKLGPTQLRYPPTNMDMVTYESYLRARQLRDEGFSKAREFHPVVRRSDPARSVVCSRPRRARGHLRRPWPELSLQGRGHDPPG